MENVIAHHAAVGAEDGNIIVPGIDYQIGGNYGGIALGGYEKGEPVSLKAIDDLDLKACHFIKIDVEGMENEVLAGATDTLKKYRPILYVENDRRERAKELIEALFSAEYRLFWHLPALFNVDNFFGVEGNIFGNLISRNMFCMPNESEINVANFTEITSADDAF